MRRRRTVPALLLALSVFATLAALTGFQATGATAGPRLLGRLAAAILELDRWSPQHREELQTIAGQRTRGLVDVSGLPIPVSIAPADALGGDGALGASIATAAGQALYEQGRAAFGDGRGGAGGSMSVTEPSRWAISLLASGNYATWHLALVLGIGVCLAALALMVATSSSGLSGAFRAIAIGGVAFAIACTLAWLVTTATGQALTAPPDKEVASIFGTCAWMGLRDSLAVVGASLALTLALRLLAQTDPRLENWPAVLDEPV